jgi:MFS family permease
VNALATDTVRVPGFIQGVSLLLPVTLSVMGIVLLVPVLPEILREYASAPGSEYVVQLGILTMPALCMLLFSAPAGWVADRFGRRPILIVSMIVYALFGAAPLLLQLSNVWVIVATRVVVGLCEAVVMTTTTAMIADYYTGPSRDRWLSSQVATASLSALVFFTASGYLGSQYGWRGPFGVYLVSLVFVALVILFTWEPTPSRGESALRSGAPAGEFPLQRIVAICAITVFAAALFYTFQTQAGIALDELGVTDPAARGKLTALASFGVPAGALLYSFVGRFHVGALLCFEFLLIGVTFVLMGRAPDSQAFTIAAFFGQVGAGLVLPTLLIWSMRGLEFSFRGRATGMWQGSFAAGQFLSGGVATALAGATGGLLSALVVIGAVSIAAAVPAFIGWLRTRT